MTTARLSVPEHRYVLAGVQNVTVTRADGDLHYETSPLGLLVCTASDAVTATLDILYRPEPDRVSEGWTLVTYSAPSMHRLGRESIRPQSLSSSSSKNSSR
jgi:hypothetical protein